MSRSLLPLLEASLVPVVLVTRALAIAAILFNHADADTRTRSASVKSRTDLKKLIIQN